MNKLKRVFDPLNSYRWIYITIIVVLLAFALCLLHYIFSNQETLIGIYFPKDHRFYKSDEFTTHYFTAKAKKEGNSFAVAGIMICIFFAVYIIAVLRKKGGNKLITAASVKRAQIIWHPFVLMLAGCFFWYQGITKSDIGPDEVFSALFSAEAPLSTTWSYYMLPNNHILFNLLNNIVSRVFFSPDTVATGRAISLVAYLLTLYASYLWMCKQVKSKAVALIACLPIALQFMTFIYSFQDRGYELQLLLTWLSFMAMFNYLVTSSQRDLNIFAITSALSFAVTPTFLYFFLAQFLLCISVQLYERKLQWRFVFCLLCMGAAVYLFYLPAICFSGVDSLINNDYVKQLNGDYTAFVPGFYIALKKSANYMFAHLIEPDHIISLILFLLPLLLFFSRNRSNRLLAIFYVFLWLTWGAMCFKMYKVSYCRTLIAHFSITIALLAYTCYLIISAALNWIRLNKLRVVAAGVLFAVPVIFFTNSEYKSNMKYENYTDEVILDMNIKKELAELGHGSSIGVSPWSFCYYYFARKSKMTAHLFPAGNEDYYVSMDPGIEPLPDNIKNNYVFLKKVPDGFVIFKRK